MISIHTQHVTLNLPPGDAHAVKAFVASLKDGYHPSHGGYPAVLTPPAYGERWAGQGGLYVGSWPAMLGLPARHLIAGESEIEDTTYGGRGHDEPGAASRVDGPANTAALLASGHEHPAAQWAAAYTSDGHTDFHLPAQSDLFLAWLCAPHIFNKEGWYLSSSQTSADYAFVQYFAYGHSYWDGKGHKFRARAFRWIRT